MEATIWCLGFRKIGGTFLGVLVIKIIVFLGFILRPHYFGKLHHSPG